MRKIRVFVLLSMVMTSMAWAQDKAPKVAVMPFVIHGQPDAAKTQKLIVELLNRQFTAESIRVVDLSEVEKAFKPGEGVRSEDQAKAAGRKFQADFAVMGSFNQIGNSISLDAKLVDISGRKKTEILFAEEKGAENLAAATNKLTQQASIHLLAKGVLADVQVRGNDRIEAEAIKAAVKSKKGEVLRADQVAEDIKTIYKMGFFEKVETDVSDTPAGKVLTFVVLENPSIQEVKVAGNSKIKEKDILAAISTKSFTILQKNVVTEDVQKIIKLYHQKGYFNVDVQSNIEFPKDPRKAVITFSIKENKKLLIKKIAFTGNKHFSSRELRSVMQTKEKSLLSLFTDRGILQKDILDTDVDRLSVFYHDRGYMDAKVGTPDVARKDDGFTITVPIEEGERYKVSGVKITGDTLDNVDMEKLPKKMESKKGEYFSREKLRHDIDSLSKKYMDKGYAHTDVNPLVSREPSDRTTDITFDVKKKEMFHIGRIYISGNTKTRDKVIRRELKLAEGDLYSSTKLEKSLASLKKMDYFEEAEITPSESDQPGILNLHVKVKEKSTNTISVGGGYSSDAGAFASGEIQWRNFMGKGQSLGVKGFFGQKAQRYVISFTEPRLFDSYFGAGIDIYNWVRDYHDFRKDAAGFVLRSAYPFGSYSRIMAAYTYENANVSNITSGSSAVLFGDEGRHTKSSITLGAERDTTDHPFLPTKGTLSTVTVEYAGLGGDSDFLRGVARSGSYFPLFWKFIGHARGEFGYIAKTGGDSGLPIYERFFLGGIDSLRAFQWGDIGPKEGDTVVGGTTYGLVNLEVLFPLFGLEKFGMRGVVFVDAGNAYRDLSDFDVSDFRTDVGAGIRWNSPFGPLRVEVGYNLDKRQGEKTFQFQFSAGAFF